VHHRPITGDDDRVGDVVEHQTREPASAAARRVLRLVLDAAQRGEVTAPPYITSAVAGALAGLDAEAGGEMLTVVQAARRLRVSEETVRRRIADGTLRATRVGRLVRLSVRAVDGLARPQYRA
jgi:excisionase family DNA binding protein